LSPSVIAIKVFEFVILLFSLSFHECAHAWMASRLGDQTARLEGRVTLNPMYHIDPVGTLLFPALVIFGPLIGFNFFSGFLVGWAKPTPVTTRNFKKITRDDNLVTLAGPASNLLLVLVAFVIMAVTVVAVPGGRDIVRLSFLAALGMAPPFAAQPALMICSLAILINFSLLFFNLFPIPPLDGSRLLRNALPYNAVQKYDRIPFWVSYLLMIFVGGFILSLLLSPSISLVFAALMSL
jgi:Zn-dependent protease